MYDTTQPKETPYDILPVDSIEPEDIRELYDSVGWSAYTQDINKLVAAIKGSDFLVVAKQEDQLVGLTRAISDDASIVYIQDILVQPSHQGKGLGKQLVKAVLHRYAHVRQKVLLTDDRPDQLQFYGSLGFTNTRTLEKTPLNAFVIIEGVDLS